MFERVLVPLDGSDLAEQALPYAEELSRALDSEIHLLYVCESAETEYRHMYQLYLEKIAQGLRENVKLSRLDGSSATRVILLDGDPASAILDYAEKNTISLMVIGSHGRSGMGPWQMGSVAVRVTQRIETPVLFVRAARQPPEHGIEHPFERILLPLDGSGFGEAALSYVKELVGKVTSEVTLMHVVPPGQHVQTIGGSAYVPLSESRLAEMELEARNYLDKVALTLKNTKATVLTEVVSGDAAQEVIKLAREKGVSLVAMSTHGRSGIRRWFSGSVANKVLQAGTTPLLLVRPLLR